MQRLEWTNFTLYVTSSKRQGQSQTSLLPSRDKAVNSATFPCAGPHPVSAFLRALCSWVQVSMSSLRLPSPLAAALCWLSSGYLRQLPSPRARSHPISEISPASPASGWRSLRLWGTAAPTRWATPALTTSAPPPPPKPPPQPPPRPTASSAPVAPARPRRSRYGASPQHPQGSTYLQRWVSGTRRGRQQPAARATGIAPGAGDGSLPPRVVRLLVCGSVLSFCGVRGGHTGAAGTSWFVIGAMEFLVSSVYTTSYLVPPSRFLGCGLPFLWGFDVLPFRSRDLKVAARENDRWA